MTRKILEDIKIKKSGTTDTFRKSPVVGVSKIEFKPALEHKKEVIPEIKLVKESKPIEEPKIIKEFNKTEEEKEVDLDKSREASSDAKYSFLNKHSFSPNTQSNKRISYTPQMPTKKPFNKAILYAFIISLVIAIFYLFSTVFFRATVTVVPKTKTFNLDGQKFTAAKKGNIPFEVMIVDDIENKSVVLTSSRESSDAAKGQIILYNNYSNKPVKITAGAFVSDDKGKSYKIDNTISIPGYTMNNSKIVPGEILVGITSFFPGEAYNGSPEIFYINSFKNTDKYKKIFGKIKSPLEGGSVGLVYFIDDEEKAKILSNVTTSRDKLLKKMNALVPEGYILYKDAVNYSYNIDSNILSKTPNTKIDIHGNLSAILLKKSDLTSSVIDTELPDITKEEKSEILEPDLSSLSFNFTNKNFVINKDIDTLEFELKGNLVLDWKPNIDGLKRRLLGKNKNEITSIFKQDPGITGASVSIIPFWAKKIPSQEEKISIIMKK